MAQSLTEIKALLAAHGLRPKHRYGQNFLHDGNHMTKIMDAASLVTGDVVLEVGPGTGALTERLLEAGASVIAVEIDTDLEPVLHERLDEVLSDAPFNLIVGDVLAGKHEINPLVIESLLALMDSPNNEKTNPSRAFKLIANLPYNVASPLLVNLAMVGSEKNDPLQATSSPCMTDAVVMLQKEVAGRINAPPGGKDYGPLGIILQALYETRIVGSLSPQCFWPAPKVASAVIAMHRRTQPLTRDPVGFAEFVHRIFAARRKQLRGILGADFAFPGDINPTQRPETLSVEQIVALSGLTA